MSTASHGFRLFAVAILAPVVVTIVAVVVSLTLAASGPSRVATHWDAAGHIDGYGSPYIYPILMAAVSVAIITLLGGATVLSAHHHAVTPVIKLLAVTSLWVTVFLGIGFTGALLDQRTAADVTSAHGPALALIVGALIAAAVGVGAWFILPKGVRSPAGTDPVAPVSLTESERASWLRTATASRRVIVGFVGIGLVLCAVEITVVLLSDGRLWWFAFVPIVALVIVLSNMTFTVRVDSRGVRIRSVLGFPSISIPLDNIVSADVVDVNAFSDYGGWGVRWNLGGRIGIILRSGQALEVRRRKGLVVVITVDDATSAAALVNGLVQRQAALS
jgi:Protein of unknown function (DUF1648)